MRAGVFAYVRILQWKNTLFTIEKCVPTHFTIEKYICTHFTVEKNAYARILQ